jgi:hypothetical protein
MTLALYLLGPSSASPPLQTRKSLSATRKRNPELQYWREAFGIPDVQCFLKKLGVVDSEQAPPSFYKNKKK